MSSDGARAWVSKSDEGFNLHYDDPDNVGWAPVSLDLLEQITKFNTNIFKLVKHLESELDGIGQYAETEGVDWCRGAAETLQYIIFYLKELDV